MRTRHQNHDYNNNKAETDAASEILGKERHRKKLWVTRDVLDLCDKWKDLNKKRYKGKGAKEYRKANKRSQKAVKKAKHWLGTHRENITCLHKINSKRAYQLVKDLSKEKQSTSSSIRDRSVVIHGVTFYGRNTAQHLL